MLLLRGMVALDVCAPVERLKQTLCNKRKQLQCETNSTYRLLSFIPSKSVAATVLSAAIHLVVQKPVAAHFRHQLHGPALHHFAAGWHGRSH